MKKYLMSYCLCITLWICVIILSTACSQKPDSIIQSENIAKNYYSMEDFRSIIIGKSTLSDVTEIAFVESLYSQSYGALCELPMEDGRYIQIKFLGNDMIVGSIEVVEESLFN